MGFHYLFLTLALAISEGVTASGPPLGTAGEPRGGNGSPAQGMPWSGQGQSAGSPAYSPFQAPLPIPPVATPLL